jgi:hypothetical protein
MKMHSMGYHMTTKAAPKRFSLKMFGGPLSIEEFRSGTSNVQMMMPNETHKMPTFVTSNLVATKKSAESDEVVLKRTKPLARAKSTLETSLGITRRKAVL